MKKASLLEEFSSHPAVSAGTALIGTMPVLSIVPALLNSTANARMQKRFEEAITALNDELADMKEKVDQMSDAQFKFVCEAVQSMQRTIDTEKLELIRQAVFNAVANPPTDLDTIRAEALSRIVRDVSAPEIQFLINSAGHSHIGIRATGGPVDQDSSFNKTMIDENWYVAEPNVVTQALISGLLSLGLLEVAQDWAQGYVPTPLAFSLLELVLPVKQCTELQV